MYKFNALFDDYVFLPVVNAYEFVTPDFIEARVTGLLLQPDRVPQCHQRPDAGAPRRGGRAVIRFALNSTVGVLGLFDVATPMGWRSSRQDFGLTLGHWGVLTGPI